MYSTCTYIYERTYHVYVFERTASTKTHIYVYTYIYILPWLYVLYDTYMIKMLYAVSMSMSCLGKKYKYVISKDFKRIQKIKIYLKIYVYTVYILAKAQAFQPQTVDAFFAPAALEWPPWAFGCANEEGKTKEMGVFQYVFLCFF